MIFILALLPATVLVIGGYFVMFLSNRSEGQMRTFGRYLSFWAFTLAGLVILGAIFAAATIGSRGGPGFGRAGFMMRGGPGFGGPGFMMRGGPGFGGREFFYRRFNGQAPPAGVPGGRGAPAPGGRGGPGAGGNAAPAPAPAAPGAAPTPGPA